MLIAGDIVVNLQQCNRLQKACKRDELNGAFRRTEVRETKTSFCGMPHTRQSRQQGAVDRAAFGTFRLEVAAMMGPVTSRRPWCRSC
eukprot:SM000034S12810  [mRNA]  locus=s34:878215:881724:- [translate_table: standard]